MIVRGLQLFFVSARMRAASLKVMRPFNVLMTALLLPLGIMLPDARRSRMLPRQCFLDV